LLDDCVAEPGRLERLFCVREYGRAGHLRRRRHSHGRACGRRTVSPGSADLSPYASTSSRSASARGRLPETHRDMGTYVLRYGRRVTGPAAQIRQGPGKAGVDRNLWGERRCFAGCRVAAARRERPQSCGDTGCVRELRVTVHRRRGMNKTAAGSAVSSKKKAVKTCAPGIGTTTGGTGGRGDCAPRVARWIGARGAAAAWPANIGMSVLDSDATEALPSARLAGLETGAENTPAEVGHARARVAA